MPCAKCIPNSAKAKTVTVGKGQKGNAGAVFDLASGLGSVSDKRAANGGVIACVKKGEENNLNEEADGLTASHYCGAEGRRASHRTDEWACSMAGARNKGSALESLQSKLRMAV
jgi:hypothetical protein